MSIRVRRHPRRPFLAAALTRAGAVCVALALVVPAVTAQSDSTTRRMVRQGGESSRLRLGEVYAEAARSNPRAAAARSLARAASARVPSAKRPPDPQLQLGLMNYEVPGLQPMDPLGMTQLQLMQMLPIGGKLRLNGDVAESRAAAEAERAIDVAWEVRSRVAMAFYDLYATDQSLLVARQTLRLLQDVARTAEAMYRVGEGRQVDVLRAQVEIARMTEDTLRMRTMRTGMAARLSALLDHAADDSVAIPELPAFPADVPSLDSLQQVAALERPMIRAGGNEVRAAGAATRLARRELIPDLQLGVQYGQRGSEMGTERMGSLMVGASIPIFARDRQLRMREEATAMRQMAEAELAAMRADTRASVAESYASLIRARRLATLYRRTVIPQAEATVSSALAAYRVGGVDFMTLVDGRMLVNQYRQELFRLESDEGKAWAELEMLLGRELFDANAAGPTTARSTTSGAASDVARNGGTR